MGPYIRLRRFVGIGFALVLIQSTCTTALEAQTTSIPFLVNNGGSDSETTAGTADTISVGYGRMQPGTGRSTPSGVAIFGLRENDILVSEAGVPASAATTAGRIRAEVNGPLTTGLALANPGSSDAVVTFYFSDQTRNSFDSGTTTIPAGGQIAKFLNEAPFNGGSSIDGTFTFTSNLPIAAVALRGFTNERGEFLLTTLPVSPLTAATGEVVYFPHFADGGGWTTEVVLVNPTNSTISGTVEFFEQGTAGMTAQPVTLTINSQTASTFSYTIPRTQFRKLSDGRYRWDDSIRLGPGDPVPKLPDPVRRGRLLFQEREHHRDAGRRSCFFHRSGIPAARRSDGCDGGDDSDWNRDREPVEQRHHGDVCSADARRRVYGNDGLGHGAWKRTDRPVPGADSGSGLVDDTV